MANPTTIRIREGIDESARTGLFATTDSGMLFAREDMIFPPKNS